MANKENTEKSTKQYYKQRISELEKQLKDKERTIYDLRCRVKCLENKLKQPKKSAKKPLNKREAAIEKAKMVRDKLAAKNRPEKNEGKRREE
jgi:hypothetical protein